MRYEHVSVPIPRQSWGGRTFPSSNLPVSFNKSPVWQHGRGAVRCVVFHGIKIALTWTKSSKRTTNEQGEHHHRMDSIMDDRNGRHLFGSLRPSSDLERATLSTKSNPKERTGINACWHTFLVSHRNRQLGDAFPDVFFSLQWSRGFVLYGVCPWHSIGMPHQSWSAMYGLWASPRRCNSLKTCGGFFLERENISITPNTPHRAYKRANGASPSMTQEAPTTKPNPVRCQARCVNELFCSPNHPIAVNLLAFHQPAFLIQLDTIVYTFRYYAVHE